MKWFIEDNGFKPDYLDFTRTYEIRNGMDICTLFCKGRKIGEYITVDGAKKAAQHYEDSGRKLA